MPACLPAPAAAADADVRAVCERRALRFGRKVGGSVAWALPAHSWGRAAASCQCTAPLIDAPLPCAMSFQVLAGAADVADVQQLVQMAEAARHDGHQPCFPL